ncbi:unnamed protein product [Schistosoma margrebowiei]|uniref:Uncharacterized protein n=1 Tax=Schistosoma margrebowiei TaxID=48269 RepID=A0A3P8CK48_9TREM|nr:unnamed protein product [Schistosoma margrebowiei]
MIPYHVVNPMHVIESIHLYHPDNLILNLYEVVHFVDDITEFYALLIVQDILNFDLNLQLGCVIFERITV